MIKKDRWEEWILAFGVWVCVFFLILWFSKLSTQWKLEMDVKAQMGVAR